MVSTFLFSWNATIIIIKKRTVQKYPWNIVIFFHSFDYILLLLLLFLSFILLIVEQQQQQKTILTTTTTTWWWNWKIFFITNLFFNIKTPQTHTEYVNGIKNYNKKTLQKKRLELISQGYNNNNNNRIGYKYTLIKGRNLKA